jgi:hypothetical protein
MKQLLIVAFAVIIGLSAVAAMAHSGGTDKYGCHHDRKAGTYHCH